MPDCRDLLTTALKRGMMSGRISLIRALGIGSALQLFVGDFLTIIETSSSECILKVFIHGTAFSSEAGSCSS